MAAIESGMMLGRPTAEEAVPRLFPAACPWKKGWATVFP